MPSKPGRNCTRPGCAGIVRGGVCSGCGGQRAARNRAYNAQRGSSSQQGYGANWRRLRAMHLAQEPLCRHCGRQGIVTPASEVDHIVPRSNGGSDKYENLQALCKSCHSRKTYREMAGNRQYEPSTIPVTIVAGPPGSGKTTYVQQRARWGDLVIDVDALYAALSGLPWYEKPLDLLPFVLDARDAVIARLARQSDVGRAWIITGEPDTDKLDELREALEATELIVLDVSQEECYKRVRGDSRRADKAEQQCKLVDSWFKAHKRVGGRKGRRRW